MTCLVATLPLYLSHIGFQRVYIPVLETELAYRPGLLAGLLIALFHCAAVLSMGRWVVFAASHGTETAWKYSALCTAGLLWLAGQVAITHQPCVRT